MSDPTKMIQERGDVALPSLSFGARLPLATLEGPASFGLMERVARGKPVPRAIHLFQIAFERGGSDFRCPRSSVVTQARRM
jgi:hypothetical protein